jgi:hypothetical protein
MNNRLAKSALVLGGAALAAEAVYFAKTWAAYGKPRLALTDPLLDSFMPKYEVAETHQTEVAAPAALTYETACELDLLDSRIAGALFKAREFILGSPPEEEPRPALRPRQFQAIGWRILADTGHQFVMGGVIQPWRKDATFLGVPKEEFASFSEPGYVKILFTLEAQPRGADHCLFRTVTRVCTTDTEARRRFRIYWSFFSPGIKLLRRVILRTVKQNAERAIVTGM